MDKKDKVVNTYDPKEYQKKPGGKKLKGKRGFFIFLAIVAVIIALSVIIPGLTGNRSMSGKIFLGDADSLKVGKPYIGELHIAGTITEDSDSLSLTSSDSYHQKWLLKRIDEMIRDNHNKGIILYVDTPGGEVYATDEMYLKLKSYQKKTGRPVYTYMASEAASGGYYISAASDKIYANRNCWTGSIGVTMGSVYDLTGLMKKMGVKAVAIHAGKNKAMGSPTEKLTAEQKKILQGLVDEAYEQFTGIVSKERRIPLPETKKLADGRVYTARQALKNGLIDEIGTLDDVIKAIRKDRHIAASVPVKDILYKEKNSSFGLLQKLIGFSQKKSLSEYEQLKALMEVSGTYTIAYISEFRK